MAEDPFSGAVIEGGENWACLASLIETCKLNGVNPQIYFTDLITRLVNGWPQSRIDELMPWLWANQRPPDPAVRRRVAEHRLRLTHLRVTLKSAPGHNVELRWWRSSITSIRSRRWSAVSLAISQSSKEAVSSDT